MKWLYLFLANLFVLLANAQDIITPEKIQESVFNQLELFPQEKIHLHTDRDIYIPGEKIWFKAYIVDALTHQSPTNSQYVYVELIGPSDSLFYRVMLSPDDNELFHGNIFLSSFIPEGDYVLRAYTRYMENLGDDYFFKKHIRISNLNSETKQEKKHSNVNYDVNFYPEGGYLIEGVVSKVAFKALNRDGTSEPITGEIVDKNGNILEKVNTVFAGMGSFSIIPKEGEEYYLKCKNHLGQEKRFKLPAIKKTYTIALDRRNKRYLVEIKKSPGMTEEPLSLLIHCKGQVLYYDSWNHNNPFISFPCERFPSGVLQFLLFDAQMNPVSERLVFNKNDDFAKLVFSTDKPSYQIRENVISEIYVTNAEGNPISGNVSIAVTDDKDISVDNENTIISSLLLSSELKGYIESPGYYLQDNPEAESALNLLMMTNGWRRYDIPEVIKGNYTLPKIEFELAKEISGLVKSYFREKPLKSSEVLLTSNEGNYAQIKTDSSGYFCFIAHYPDSIKFLIQARNQKGSARVVLELNREKYPELKYTSKSPLLVSSDSIINNQTKFNTHDFIKKAEQRAKHDEGIWQIQLQEVEITAKSSEIVEKDKFRLETFPLNSISDRTIYREKIEERHAHKIKDLFYDVAGVKITNNGYAYIRGYDGRALLLLDGVIQNDLSLNDIDIEEVETIDIFKGPMATVFGRQGSNGAISITSRHGNISNKQVDNNYSFATLAPLGFQKPVEFYSPKYDTPEAKKNPTPDFRTTIFWKPDLMISDNGKVSFDFYTSDFPTTYSVVIEGLSDEGEIIRQVETINVKF